MDYKIKIAPPDLIMEPLLGILDEAETVPLVISGSSMSPFLIHGRDTVYLSKPRRPLKKGDMVLYQRHNGAYVLHRILKADHDCCTMVGDAQTCPESGIQFHQIRAIVTAVCRKGRLLRSGCFVWDFFEKVWIRLVPLRPAMIRLYLLARRCFFGKGEL